MLVIVPMTFPHQWAGVRGCCCSNDQGRQNELKRLSLLFWVMSPSLPIHNCQQTPVIFCKKQMATLVSLVLVRSNFRSATRGRVGCSGRCCWCCMIDKETFCTRKKIRTIGSLCNNIRTCGLTVVLCLQRHQSTNCIQKKNACALARGRVMGYLSSSELNGSEARFFLTNLRFLFCSGNCPIPASVVATAPRPIDWRIWQQSRKRPINAHMFSMQSRHLQPMVRYFKMKKSAVFNNISFV